jgi:phosphohistidine phosphatase
MSRLRKEAKALEALGVGIDHIITSPLTRTKQTADVLAETLKSRPSVSTSDALAPAGTAASVVQELGRHMRKGRIALVGHEPNMGELAARLIGARVPLEFKKGAICRIDFEIFPPKGMGQLRWFVTPRMLRRIG